MNELTQKRRLRFLQTLCRGLIVGVVGINVVVGTIVWYALDGIPLAGHRFAVGGVSVATIVAALLALVVPAVSLRVAKSKVRTALAANPGQIVEAFAMKTSVEYLPVVGLGFAFAGLYHFTADPTMLVLVAGLLAYLIARFPTTKRANAWVARVTSPVPS